VVMAKPVIKFPQAPQLDDDTPIEWATLQIGSTRLVLDLRGPEPKFRTDPADVVPMAKQPKQRRKKVRAVAPIIKD
jgi:hypothetical protein